MNNIYKQYLDRLGIISEEDFVKLLSSLPEFDTLDDSGIIIDSEPIEVLFNDGVLQDYDFSASFIDETNKLLDLDYYQYDDKTIADLELLNKELSEKGWTIENYDSLLESLEEDLEETDDSRIELLKEISENATTEQLRKIVNSL